MPRTERRDVYASASTRHTRPLTTAAAPGDWNWRARNNASPELNAEIEFPFLKRHEGFSLLFQRWILPEVRGRQRKANRRVRKHQLSAPHVGSEGRRDKCCKLLHLSDVGWGQIYEKPHVSIPQKQCSDEKVVPKLVDGRKNLGTDFFFLTTLNGSEDLMSWVPTLSLYKLYDPGKILTLPKYHFFPSVKWCYAIYIMGGCEHQILHTSITIH